MSRVVLAMLGVIALLVSCGLQTEKPGNTGAGAAPSATIAPQPAVAVLVAHRAVLEQGAGGGPTVVTDAFDSFRLLKPDGSAIDARVQGVAVGMPVFDGTDQVVYWSRTAVFSGSYRLMVWSLRTRQERVLIDAADVGPAGSPIWTVDTRAVVLNVRGPGALRRGAHN